jgi:hypothetical protein
MRLYMHSEPTHMPQRCIAVSGQSQVCSIFSVRKEPYRTTLKTKKANEAHPPHWLIIKLSNPLIVFPHCLIITLSNWLIVFPHWLIIKLSNWLIVFPHCRIAKLSNCQIITLSNYQIG